MVLGLCLLTVVECLNFGWRLQRPRHQDQRPSSFEKFSGGCVERVTPVPIPNTEVKPLGADGTARATAWESRKPPGLFAEISDFKFEISKKTEEAR